MAMGQVMMPSMRKTHCQPASPDFAMSETNLLRVGGGVSYVAVHALVDCGHHYARKHGTSLP